MHLNAQIDLGPLSREELAALFLDETFSTYYSQMREEIIHRTSGLEDQTGSSSKRSNNSLGPGSSHSAA